MSPVEFYELPQDTPSQTQIEPGVGYCTVTDVQAMNFARSIGIGSNPGPSQVSQYILMVSGEIDAVCAQKGYVVPVNSASSPVAGRILNGICAKGAWALMESAAPNSLNIDRAKAAYDEAMKLLSDAKFVLPDAPTNPERMEARAPWITFHPTGDTYDPVLADIGGLSGDGISGGPGRDNNPANPFFSRQMRF